MLEIDQGTIVTEERERGSQVHVENRRYQGKLFLHTSNPVELVERGSAGKILCLSSKRL